jgi:hypothetical protein
LSQREMKLDNNSPSTALALRPVPPFPAALRGTG